MNSFSSDMLVLAAFAIGISTIPFLYRALKNKRGTPSWVASRPVSNQGSASDSCVCGHPRRTHNSSGHCSESRWVRELGRMAVCRCIQFQSTKLAPQALREAPRNETTGSASSFSRVEDAAQVKVVAQPSLAPGEAAQGNSTSVPQTMAVEKVPQFPFARGDAEQMSLSPVQETQRLEEIPQSSLASGDPEHTSLPPLQETPRLEEIPQSSLASGDAEQTSLPPLRYTSQAGEVPPPPVTPDDVDLDKELVPPRFLDSYGLRERSEEHTSELQSRPHLVCRLLL